MEYIIQAILAFFACIGFAVVYNAPKRHLIFCGITGAIGWFVYSIVDFSDSMTFYAVILSSMAITTTSRILSHVRREPSTIFLIPGILPLVPGTGMYYAMYYMIYNEPDTALQYLADALKVAGGISLGIVIILSLPYSFFNFIKIKDETFTILKK